MMPHCSTIRERELMAIDYGRWSYGDAGDRIPVSPNEVWRVGPHRILCGDLEHQSTQVWLHSVSVDVVYSDPPWNASNASTFRTKARVPRKVNWPAFTQNLARLCSVASGSVFVESSRPEVKQSGYSDLVQAFTGAGGVQKDYWPVTYYKTKPSALLRFTFGEDDGFAYDLSGMDDADTPSAVLEQYIPGQIVMDPCTGQGKTPLAAAENGHIFVGTELHPRRMANALDKLSNLLEEEPICVGRIRSA